MNMPWIRLEDPGKMSHWRYWPMYFAALFRTSKKAVCLMSSRRGDVDFHDYPDSEEGIADHFILLTCKRCGKSFRI